MGWEDSARRAAARTALAGPVGGMASATYDVATGIADWGAGDRGAAHRSTAAQRASGEAAYRERSGLRSDAIAAQHSLTSGLEGQVRDQRKQAAENQKAIRFGAGQALAAGIQPGMAAGGGAIAAAGQVGRGAEAHGIKQRGADLARTQEMETRATQARREAAEYEATQGSEESDFQEAFALGSTDAEKAIRESRGLLDDKEEQAMAEIRAIVGRIRVMNPRAAAELEAEYLTQGGGGYNRINDW